MEYEPHESALKRCPNCGHWMVWVTLRYAEDGTPVGYWKCTNCDATA